MKKTLILAAILLTALPFTPVLQAASSASLGLPPLQQSDAFLRFSNRPRTERSKLLFLMDRFEKADMEIVYDGRTYDLVSAARVARLYLTTRYKQETALEWIGKFCYRSRGHGEIVWMRTPSGELHRAADIFKKELETLSTVR